MITECKEINTEKPIKEMWNYLYMLNDSDYCFEQIRKNCGSIEKKDGNVKKQIQQIKLSIKQASEYFEAANCVTVATKPLLIYYGFVSLSRALILIKKDGTYSYDYMRQSEKHNHHGLEICKEFASCKEPALVAYLKAINATVNYNGDLPWGNYAVFYEALSPDSAIITGEVIYEGSNLAGTLTKVINTADKKSINGKKEKIDLFSLLASFPDMYD